MKNSKIGKRKIEIKKDKIITRDELFKSKEHFHQASAKLPFEEKIEILMKLQEIARSISAPFHNCKPLSLKKTLS